MMVVKLLEFMKDVNILILEFYWILSRINKRNLFCIYNIEFVEF